jgi:hypothetical protein
VTQIEDAMALWEKLKAQKFEEAWKPEQVTIVFSWLIKRCNCTGDYSQVFKKIFGVNLLKKKFFFKRF